ncbi:MAG: LysR family transcriptional regulator [Myxococcota bacterium]
MLLDGQLDDLLVLQALLDTSSVKDAAGRVGLSPSAVSHALGRLRERLGDPLLVRAGQRLVPTPRAERMRPRLGAALEALARAVGEDRFAPATAERAFRIVCTDHAELGVLQPLGTALLRAAPGITLHSEVPRGDASARLRDGRADLALGAFSPAPADIRSEVLFEEHFVTLLRPGHPALDDGPLDVVRYAGLQHLLVAPGGRPRGALDDRLEALGLQRRVVRTVATFLVAPFLVADSDVVVTLPSRVAAALADRVGLVQRAPPPELDGRFPVRMLWHRRDDEDAAHRWLRARVRAG